jgi:histidinol-phosphate aminotransferase
VRDRVVVITGSSRGIGLALAVACAARGARVVVHGRDPQRVADAAATIDGAIGIASDLAMPAGAETLIAGALAACGRIDVLVNNAGTSPARGALWDAEPTELVEAIATNVTAPILCARAVLAWAEPERRAVRIVNVSSGIVALPHDRAAAYVATKAALDGFTRALARDVDPRVVITAVALGSHRTDLARRMLGDDRELPEADVAATTLLRAILAPGEQVHGRVIAPPPRELEVSGLDLLAHPLGPSPRARDALAKVAREAPLDRYPDRDHGELRKLLAARHGVPLDAIVLGGGVTELIDRVLRVATRPGETAIANTPSWPVWPHVCAQHGVGWRRVPYRLSESRADHDLDAIRRAIDRSVRIIYLTSPANPGGAALDTKSFEAFLAALPEHVTVIVDEAYADFTTREDALRASRCVQWTDQLIVLRSLSKLHGLAGLRIGYAIAARDRARVLERAAPAFPLVRGAAEAAIAALSDRDHEQRVIDHVATSRARLEQQLDARGIARLHSDAPFVLAADPDASGPRVFDRYVMLPAWVETASKK